MEWVSGAGTVIPAAPGWFVVYRADSDETPSGKTLHIGEAIIAWLIVPGEAPQPITCIGVVEGGEFIGCLRPDGNVDSAIYSISPFDLLKIEEEKAPPF